MQDFGFRAHKLRTARKAMRLTQEKLGEMIGVHVSTISRWETNDGPETKNYVALIATALGVDPQWFYENEECPEPSGVPPAKDPPLPTAVPATLTNENAMVQMAVAMAQMAADMRASTERQERRDEEHRIAMARQDRRIRKLEKRLARTEAALAAPAGPSQAGDPTAQRGSQGSGRVAM